MSGERLQVYAAQYGVEFSETQCYAAVDAFRTAYPEIPQLWYALEKYAIGAVQRGGLFSTHCFTFDGSNPKMLTVGLPSGRDLHYFHPQLTTKETYDGTRLSLTYETHTNKGWQTADTHGSKLAENVVQALARDVLVNGMMAAHRKGFQLVAHVHDELVAEVPYTPP